MFQKTTLFNHLAQEGSNIVLDELATRVGKHKDKQIYKRRMEDEAGITDTESYKKNTQSGRKYMKKSNG